MDQSDIYNRFTYHSPDNERAALHNEIRDVLRVIATQFSEKLPPGRELSLALTKLEEAMFWANASIARQPKEIS